VRSKDILDALKKPLKVKPVKVDKNGQSSQRYIGQKATTVINPESLKIISTNPTSTKTALRLVRKYE